MNPPPGFPVATRRRASARTSSVDPEKRTWTGSIFPLIKTFPPMRLLASAQDVQAGGAEKDLKNSKDAFKAHLIAFPFIFYSPETKLAFGYGGIFNFRAGRNKEQTRASTVWAFGT